MGKRNLGKTQNLQNEQATQKKTPRRFIVKRSQERVPLGNNTHKLNGATVLTTEAVSAKNQKQHQEIMKSMIEQKEKVASNQREAIKRERELSTKLRQAIAKLNVKMQFKN